jgi:hypothetical protein
MGRSQERAQVVSERLAVAYRLFHPRQEELGFTNLVSLVHLNSHPHYRDNSNSPAASSKEFTVTS